MEQTALSFFGDRVGMIFQLDKHDPRSPAVHCCAGERTYSYGQLLSMVDSNRCVLEQSRPALAMLACENTLGSLCAYLGCLAARVPVCLAQRSSRAWNAIAVTYRPTLLLLPRSSKAVEGYRPAGVLPGGYQVQVPSGPRPSKAALHESLALLLTTSGSTGSGKLVRLSRCNLESNAAAIVECLGIDARARSMQSLPMQYAYGLSLINSHLRAGATVVLTPHSFLRREFWSDFNRAACTSFAGVPYMYELLRKLQFHVAGQPTLRYLTQAGGALSASVLSFYRERAERNRKAMFVMYGQTEATARIACLPPDRLADKLGAIGRAIPGGQLSLESVDEGSDLKELVYRGPNVMLGYATSLSDLALGDTQRGVLRTGDLGRVDQDGFYYITGRLNRIAKVHGHRVNLADVESELSGRFACRVAAVERKDRIHLFVENESGVDLTTLRMRLARYLSMRPVVIRAERIHEFPRTATGKIDYSALSSCPLATRAVTATDVD
jgi:acyl-CoA synthetase (AMP-forming)/AMP-acid ligase II